MNPYSKNYNRLDVSKIDKSKIIEGKVVDGVLITSKRINAFAEMKNILRREMKEQGLTATDVKRDLEVNRRSEYNNPLLKAKKLLQKEMKKNNRSSQDVKKDLENEREQLFNQLAKDKEPIMIKNGVAQIDLSHPQYDFWVNED